MGAMANIMPPSSSFRPSTSQLLQCTIGSDNNVHKLHGSLFYYEKLPRERCYTANLGSSALGELKKLRFPLLQPIISQNQDYFCTKRNLLLFSTTCNICRVFEGHLNENSQCSYQPESHKHRVYPSTIYGLGRLPV